MKIMFMLVSIGLAVTLSVLAAIILTGQVPFAEKTAVVAEETDEFEEVYTVERMPVSVFAGQAQVVDELVEQLKEQISKNQKIEEDLKQEKETLENKMSQMQKLQDKLASLREEVETKIVMIGENEQGNFKQLADMYSKMEPESASQLLQKVQTDRAAKIISLIDQRQAAAIMNASVAMGAQGAGNAAEWTDAIRRMNGGKNAQL